MSARRLLFAALIAWVVLLAVPFFLSPKRPAEAGRTLTLISPHSPEILDEYIAAFEALKAAQGDPVHVERIVVGGGSEVSRRVENDLKSITVTPALPENSPPGTPPPEPVLVRKGMIDVMWGGGTDPYIGLGKMGAFDPYIPPAEIDAAIPAQISGVVIKPVHHQYIGSAFAGFGIVVNKKYCSELHLPEPKDWDDLANPRFFDTVKGRGRLGNADIRMASAIRQCYEAVLQSQGWEHGWQTLCCIAGNSAQFYRGSSQTPEEVGMGNVVAGFSYDRPAMAEIDHRGADTIAFVLPPLTVISPDAIAILKGAPEPALAKEFVDFVLSKQGQSLWLLNPGVTGGPRQYPLRRMPVRRDVYTLYPAGDFSIQLNPFTYSFKRANGTPFEFNDKVAGKRRKTMPDLAGAALIDSHPELVAAWARIVKDGMRPEALKAFAQMPVTEKEIAELDAVWSKDPAAREAKLVEWKNFFRAKYARIVKDGQ